MATGQASLKFVSCIEIHFFGIFFWGKLHSHTFLKINQNQIRAEYYCSTWTDNKNRFFFFKFRFFFPCLFVFFYCDCLWLKKYFFFGHFLLRHIELKLPRKIFFPHEDMVCRATCMEKEEKRGKSFPDRKFTYDYSNGSMLESIFPLWVNYVIVVSSSFFLFHVIQFRSICFFAYTGSEIFDANKLTASRAHAQYRSEPLEPKIKELCVWVFMSIYCIRLLTVRISSFFTLNMVLLYTEALYSTVYTHNVHGIKVKKKKKTA